MPKAIRTILDGNTGLMTIDWVVLAAATIGLTLSALASVELGYHESLRHATLPASHADAAATPDLAKGQPR